MRRKGITVTPERMAEVEVDPGLALAVIEKMAAGDRWALMERRELLPLCLEVCAGHDGYELGAGAMNERRFEVICALSARIEALSGLMESGQIEPGDASHEAMAAATSAAALRRDEDGFSFQPRQFFALLDGADAGPRE